MDPASPRDVTSPPKQNTLNAALRQEQEGTVQRDGEEQAAQVIQVSLPFLGTCICAKKVDFKND
jgi:hypothetical protein